MRSLCKTYSFQIQDSDQVLPPQNSSDKTMLWRRVEQGYGNFVVKEVESVQTWLKTGSAFTFLCQYKICLYATIFKGKGSYQNNCNFSKPVSAAIKGFI